MIIKNINIIDYKSSFKGNIHIIDGKIAKIEYLRDLDTKDYNQGLCLMPSFIDLHFHTRYPGFPLKEDKISGSYAALKGGYTSICAMANTNPVCDNKKLIKEIKKDYEELDLVDLIQICAVTKNLEGSSLVDFNDIKEETKFFSDDGKTILDEQIMIKALKESKKEDFKILTHCQPESLIIKRDMKLLKNFGGNLHICHVSSKESIDEIRRRKDEGLKFSLEVTPHHLFSYDLDYKVNPKIRTKDDVKALIKAIKDDYIDIIATDHAPHTKEDKLKGSPGISNIENSFAMINKVFYENDIDMRKLSLMMSKRPANMLCLNSGEITKDYDANLVLVDLSKKTFIDSKNFISKGKNTPFDNYETRGEIIFTMKNGNIKYRKENFDIDNYIEY
ncbi:MAG: dihydroorotase [Peptostreptococcaceae bacterium]|jgi:dihydroorotase|nr:dihydroorotase [Peptostreptococcaceae bacterium]